MTVPAHVSQSSGGPAVNPAGLGSIETPTLDLGGGGAPEKTGDGEGEGTETETPAVDPAAQPDPNAQPPKKLAGRFDKPEDLEKEFTSLETRYQASSREGLRLSGESKVYKQELTQLRTKLAELEKAQTPPFKELDEAQLNELHKSNPAAFYKYQRDLNAWHADQKTRTDAAERTKQEVTKHADEMKTALLTSWQKMESSPAEYPHFVELQPAIDQLADLYPHLMGHHDTAEQLYLMALGLASKSSLKKGKQLTAQERARQAEAAKNNSAHVQEKPPGTGSAPAGKKLDPALEKIKNAGPKSFFPGS